MSTEQEIIDYIVETVDLEGGVTVRFNEAAKDEMASIISELIWIYDFVVTEIENGIIVERKYQ